MDLRPHMEARSEKSARSQYTDAEERAERERRYMEMREEELRKKREAERIKQEKRDYIKKHFTPDSVFLKRSKLKKNPGSKHLWNVNYIFIWVTPHHVHKKKKIKTVNSSFLNNVSKKMQLGPRSRSRKPEKKKNSKVNVN